MSTPPVVFNHVPKPAKDNPAKDDDMSEVTAPQSRPARANDQTMVSKVLKFSFVYSNQSKHKVAPSVIHTHWIQAVQESLGSDIVIVNKQNENVEAVSTLKWSHATIHQKQFKLYQQSRGRDDKRSTTYFIVHRILTNESISKIKAIPSVKRLLKEYQCFLTDYQWTESQWETTRIGFITNYDPSFYNRTQAAAKFNAFLHSLPGKTKIPKFRLVFTSPQVRHPTHTVSTKAYAIEVLQEDSSSMLQVLKSLLNDTPAFVPYSYRKKYPAGFEKAIRYQTTLLTSTMVVILQNISSDMMFYLQPHIMQIPGVRDMVESPKGRDVGRYSLLVDKDSFKQIRTTIATSLDGWISSDVPPDAEPHEGQFPGPARVKPLYDDDNSSGANTWMTQSSASFMSVDNPSGPDDDYFTNSMNANRIFSYAEVVLPSMLPPESCIPVNPDSFSKAPVSEIIATAPTEVDHHQRQAMEQMAAEHQQAAEQATQIIEAQRLEIEQLKAQRLEDIALRLSEVSAAKDKAQAQDDATSVLRDESAQTKLEISELRRDMHAMIAQFRSVLPVPILGSPASATKRTLGCADDNIDDNIPSEKRRDVRSTPGKQLCTEDMDLSDSPSYLSAKEADSTYTL
jgi:hypothetical protein